MLMAGRWAYGPWGPEIWSIGEKDGEEETK
jgi:hypothetical protein